MILDSFAFCGLRFQISRDCDKKSEVNCCSHNLSPPQVGCYNGTTLSWDYFKTKEIASDIVESIVDQMMKQQKEFKNEPITCNLSETKVKRYRLICTTKENNKWSEIIHPAL